jgi:hypothetical protein
VVLAAQKYPKEDEELAAKEVEASSFLLGAAQRVAKTLLLLLTIRTLRTK